MNPAFSTSKVAVNLLGLQPLRPLGSAELAWRTLSDIQGGYVVLTDFP